MAPHSSIPAGESHGQRSLVGYSPWAHRESDPTEAMQHTRLLWGLVSSDSRLPSEPDGL